MKRFALLGTALMSFLTGCGTQQENTARSQTMSKAAASSGTVKEIAQTGMSTAVPDDYLQPIEQAGTVTQITHDSKDFVRDGSDITKTAYVYLPYGYDETDTATRYDICYLMHGWGGHAGEYFEYANITDMLDNMIAKGDIPPTIFVSATFYNDNSDTDFSSSVAEFRQFHRDFEEYLMPAVEGQFHTYAESTSPDDLKASRDHRAFGGFSLGSVTTWLQFCYDSDYIRCFLPMSGSCWYYGGYSDFQIEKNVDFIQQFVEDNDLDERGYYIYHGVGTNDTVKSQSIDMAEEMLSRSEVFTPDHYVFYQREGGQHDHISCREFMYNALPLFFGGDTVQTDEVTENTTVGEVKNMAAFGDFGRLLFPVDRTVSDDMTLKDVSSSSTYTWYNYIKPEKTVEIVNYLKNAAENGQQIFYNIYTEEEMQADSEIGCKVRSIELNVMQRCSSHLSSRTDIDEAEAIGAAVVRTALSGETGKVMLFRRISDMPYTVTIDVAAASDIANKEKFLPKKYINTAGNNIRDFALSYFLPLIQGDLNLITEQGIPKHFALHESVLK